MGMPKGNNNIERPLTTVQIALKTILTSHIREPTWRGYEMVKPGFRRPEKCAPDLADHKTHLRNYEKAIRERRREAWRACSEEIEDCK